jgi:hypothetical protein
MSAKKTLATPDVILDLTTTPSISSSLSTPSISSSLSTTSPRVATSSTPTPSPSVGKKRAIAETTPKPKARKKSEKPHVIIWICHHGHGDRGWKMKNPKVIGVYGSKEEAEARKEQLIRQHGGECGHGNICVGGTWEDEIDLLIRPVDECTI